MNRDGERLLLLRSLSTGPGRPDAYALRPETAPPRPPFTHKESRAVIVGGLRVGYGGVGRGRSAGGVQLPGCNLDIHGVDDRSPVETRTEDQLRS